MFQLTEPPEVEPTDDPLTKYSTLARFASVAVAPKVTVSETTAPAVGEPTDAVGAVLSTTLEPIFVCETLLAASRTS